MPCKLKEVYARVRYINNARRAGTASASGDRTAAWFDPHSDVKTLDGIRKKQIQLEYSRPLRLLERPQPPSSRYVPDLNTVVPMTPESTAEQGRSGQFGFTAIPRWRCIVLSPERHLRKAVLWASPDRWHRAGVSHSQRRRCSAVSGGACSKLGWSDTLNMQKSTIVQHLVWSHDMSQNNRVTSYLLHTSAVCLRTPKLRWCCTSMMYPIDVRRFRRWFAYERGRARPLCCPVLSEHDLNSRMRMGDPLPDASDPETPKERPS